MDATGGTEKATAPERATAPEAEGATTAPHPAGDHPFGPDGAAILATEHWSLLASRSLIWNEAMSRATVFLSVLSASTIALALLADATGFGPQTTTLALVQLPVVLFLGIAAHGRLVEINREEVELSLAMNRLRHAYLKIAPLRLRSSCSWCGRPRPGRRSPWWRGRWRSWSSGRRCSCCNAAPWTRCAGRRRGSLARAGRVGKGTPQGRLAASRLDQHQLDCTCRLREEGPPCRVRVAVEPLEHRRWRRAQCPGRAPRRRAGRA